jgi:thiol-disulfide isomerase/thioredoxin
MTEMPVEPNPLSVPTDRNGARKYRMTWVLLAVAAMVFVGIRWFPRKSPSQPLSPFASKGHEAPNFALSTPDGKIVRLSDYRGKAVLINFFGTTCVPCREESPHLVEMQRRNAARGFEIIGIDVYGSSNDAIEKYRKDFGTTYVLVHGNDTVGDQYGVGELPVSYFLNAKGTVVASTIGLRPEKEMDNHVEAALRGE